MVAPSVASAAKFLSTPPNTVQGFILYGSDTVQIASRAETLIRALSAKATGAEIIRLHDSDLAADPTRIGVELGTGSLFGGTKILWMTSLPAKAQASVADIVSRPLENSYLVVQAPDLKKSHKLVQTFEAAPYLAAVASYGEDRESLAATIHQQIAAAGYVLEEGAAALIVLRCDGSFLLARSGAEKLMTFAGSSRYISVADVEACLVDQQTAGLSEIADHTLNGEGKRAVLALERFMAVEQNITPVMAVLSSSLQRLHSLKVATDSGTAITQAIKELRPPVFFKQQDVLAAQVRRWTKQDLEAQIAAFNDALKETRLRPALAGDIANDLLLKIAGCVKNPREAAKPLR